MSACLFLYYLFLIFFLLFFFFFCIFFFLCVIHLSCGCQGGGGGSGMDREFGVNRCKLLPLEWISGEILFYSTCNYIQSLMMEHDNVRKRMYICICDWVTMTYSRKMTEHCKPAIMGKNKNHYVKKPKKRKRLSEHKKK